jgi:RimJ/RimL family protein N-acetyltransferase
MSLTLRPMDEAGVRELAAWRYEPPYDMYNIPAAPENMLDIIAFLVDPENAYVRIDNERGELEAFGCFGLDAQVPGGDYRDDALDLGLGVRPDLTGRGLGAGYALALVEHARAHYALRAVRVTIAGFNVRAQRAWQKAGFVHTQTFADDRNGRPYVVLTRDL